LRFITLFPSRSCTVDFGRFRTSQDFENGESTFLQASSSWLPHPLGTLSLSLALFPFFYIFLCLSEKLKMSQVFICMFFQRIPVAFFLKNIEGRYEQKTAELRSDASKITWEVKIDGQRLTDGWKEFALSHDLRIGDIVVFRQERDMSFHVTMLGPSCCEIQYGSCSDEERNLGKLCSVSDSSRNVV